MKQSASLITLAALALLVSASAYAARVTLARGEQLTKARPELLQQGWKPRKIERYAPSKTMDAFRNAGYLETEQCANDDYLCVLDYVNAQGACLRVVVNYNTLEPLRPWVTSWTFECPNPEILKAPAAQT